MANFKFQPLIGNKEETPKTLPSKIVTKSNFGFKPLITKEVNLPVPEKSLGQKILGVGKELAKGIISPVVTTLARPVQAVAELGGATAEQVNRFNFGGLIAPVPQNAGDVVKDVGRAIETAALGGLGAGAKTALGLVQLAKQGGKEVLKQTGKQLAVTSGLEGAAFGAGAGLEQGGTPTEILKNTAIGGAIGAVTPSVFKGIGKVFSKKAAQEVAPIVEKGTVKEVTPVIEKTTSDIRFEPIKPETSTNIKYKQPTKKELATGYEPYTPQEKLPVIETGEVPVIQSKVETKYKPIQEAEKKNIQKTIEDTFKNEEFAKDPTYKSTTEKDWVNQVADLNTKYNKDELSDIVFGKKNLPEGYTVPKNAIYETLLTDKTLTKEQRHRLISNKWSESTAGAELRATQLRDTDSFSGYADKYNAELKKKALNNVKSNNVTKKTVSRLLDDLECK